MRNKILALMVLSILSLVAILGIASAALEFSPASVASSINTGQTSVSFTFRVNNTGT